jgi:hypothetical protein
MENKRTAPSAIIARTGDAGFINVVMDGESLTLRAVDSVTRFESALESLKAKDWDALYENMRPVKSYASKIDGVEIRDNSVYFNGNLMHSVLTGRILDFVNAGLPHEPLCRFMVKLMSNPSKRATDELYTFLEHQNLPITDNGNFLAYKAIQRDWYSITASQTTRKHVLNRIGDVVEMPRNEVCDNKDIGCSYGLHAGTLEYASSFGGSRGRMVIVEIDPADVVSIPTDCSFQKLRTSRYKVIGEYTGPLVEPLYKSQWYDSHDDDSYDDYEDYDECDGDGSCDDCDCMESPNSYSFRNSSFLESIAWTDNSNGTVNIKVKYNNEPDKSSYYNVPHGVLSDWIQKDSSGYSAGRYYNDCIKGNYWV